MAGDSISTIALQSQVSETDKSVSLDNSGFFCGGETGLLDRTLPRPPFSHTPLDAHHNRELFQSIRSQLDAGLEIVPAEGNRSAVYQTAKRVFDIAGAVILLILFAPIMLAVLLILSVTTGGRPLFRQTRLGLRGRPFTMYKFRTMTIDAESRRNQVANEQDGPVFKNRSDSRVTRIGRILRVTSIDEMPQLVNVLLGQMSLVGPRPPIGAEVAQYEPWQRRRLAVKPGLTCLWQVSGRSDIGFEQWVKMDIWYVENQNFLTDLQLLLRTPRSILSRRGAY